MSAELTVRGGTGGVQARIEDLRRGAQVTGDVADELASITTTVGALGLDADVLASTPLSPGTAARVQAAAARAVASIGTSTVSVGLRGQGLTLVADGLVALDQAGSMAETTWRRLDGSTAFAAGLVGTGLHATFGFGGNVGAGLIDAVGQGRDQGWAAFFDAIGRVRGDARLATTTDVGAMWGDLVLERPNLVNGVVDGVAGIASLTRGRPVSYEETVTDLIGLGGLFGRFDDSAGLEVRRADLGPGQAEGTVVPTSIEDLFTNQSSLQGLALPDADGSRLRLVEVPGADGTSSWILHVPGTQEWSPSAGGNPSDLTTNLHLSAAGDAALLDAMDAVLTSHAVGDDAVMVVGHSQGGIAAANYAVQAGDRGHNVTHVVTGGSPIATIPVPEHVSVLAIEHHNDLVPRLDGAPNPDRTNVTTVTRDVGGRDVHDGLLEPHGSRLYRETGALIDASDEASLETFRNSAAPFFGGPELADDRAAASGLVTDHVVSREVP